jgi:hypothetical protein
MDPMSESQTEGQQAPSTEEEIAQTPASETTVPDSGTEPTSTDAPAEKTEPEAPKIPTSIQKRFDQLTRERHEGRRREEAMEARLAQLTPAQAPSQQAPVGMVPASDVRAMVEREVSQIGFVKECNLIADAGKAKFSDFQDAHTNFTMLDRNMDAFLEGIASLGTDVGAKIYYEIGKDPDEAERILSMPPVKMAMELAKRANAAPKPIPVSKVPDPIKPVQGANTRSDAEPDGKDPRVWAKWFNENRNKR